MVIGGWGWLLPPFVEGGERGQVGEGVAEEVEEVLWMGWAGVKIAISGA